MGAADFLAGDEPAGDDFAAVVPRPRQKLEFQALLFDPVTRDYPRDANGAYIPLHPVDARVTLAMTQFEGAVKCSTLGNRLRQIKYLGPRIVSEVEYEVRRVLADELRAGNIRIVGIDVEVPFNGGLAVQLRYVNLRLEPQTGNPEVQNATVRLA